ncbi:MAG: bacillithiol biosynthesis cysteine-adding enzyme BshC [Chitinophagaceae bacterium]|nr:bacillithiol biosynthesis cysteine-adding enzyme BshC [Chitinophagaceae bacterium]
MDYKTELIDYRQTGYFSKIVTDLISGAAPLKNYYQHSLSNEGFLQAITERKIFSTNRKLLVEQLQLQYADLKTTDKVKRNIESLNDPNTFTICTAHQPNLFTGHLYFIYKILHTIKLADTLNRELTGNHFVPIFYMGSEDADLAELNHIYIEGDKYEWKTKQAGAVGRMVIDDELTGIIEDISRRFSVLPFGNEITEKLKHCYQKGVSIEQATFSFVNELFSEYGLIILLPDNSILKKSMLTVFADDIFSNTSSDIVNTTSGKLSKLYKVQAHPREINLFYLKDDIRNRIIKKGNTFIVQDTAIQFSEPQLRKELNDFPERFSPNVILRGLYQEMILPNIAFVGGGGELAYWLELKDLFQHYHVPFPVLVLRNSFMLADKKANALINKLGVTFPSIFKEEAILINELVKRETTNRLELGKEKKQLINQYEKIKTTALLVDSTLSQHVDALLAKVLKNIEALEKKMVKAERSKFDAQQRQLHGLKKQLFPHSELQERVENFMTWYATYGAEFIKILYNISLTTEQQFCILTEVENKKN